MAAFLKSRFEEQKLTTEAQRAQRREEKKRRKSYRAMGRHACSLQSLLPSTLSSLPFFSVLSVLSVPLWLVCRLLPPPCNGIQVHHGRPVPRLLDHVADQLDRRELRILHHQARRMGQEVIDPAAVDGPLHPQAH